MTTEQAIGTRVPAEVAEPVLSDGSEPLVSPDAPSADMLVPQDVVKPETETPPEPDQPVAEVRAPKEPEPPQLAPEIAAIIDQRVKEAEARIQSGYGRRQREDAEALRLEREARANEQTTRAVGERVEAQRKQLQTWYDSQGIDPTAAASRIEQETENFRAAIVGAQEKATLASREAQRERALGGVGLNSWTEKLVRDHNLSETDADVLKGYYDVTNLPLLQDPQTGEIFLDQPAVAKIGGRLFRMAQRLGGVATATAAAQKSVQAANQTVLERTPAVQLETELGSPVLTDDQFIKNYSNPDHPESDHKRALDIMTKKGMSPF